MAKIEIGRYSERLRRALGMKGQELVAGELSPEVSPVIVVEDNTAEWQFLQHVRLCSSVMVQTAVAAQNTLFRLRNPAGSGIVAVLDDVSFASTVAGRYHLGFANSTGDLGTTGTTGLRDSRWSTPANPSACRASRGNNVPLNFSSSLWVTRTLAETNTVYTHGPVMIFPAEVIEFGTDSVNVEVVLTWTWKERELPELER